MVLASVCLWLPANGRNSGILDPGVGPQPHRLASSTSEEADVSYLDFPFPNLQPGLVVKGLTLLFHLHVVGGGCRLSSRCFHRVCCLSGCVLLHRGFLGVGVTIPQVQTVDSQLQLRLILAWRDLFCLGVVSLGNMLSNLFPVIFQERGSKVQVDSLKIVCLPGHQVQDAVIQFQLF